MKTAELVIPLVLIGALACSPTIAGPYSGHYGDPVSPNAFDEPIPGFVGPDGDGKCLDLGPNNYVNPAFKAWASGHVNYLPSDETWLEGDWTTPSKAYAPVTGVKSDVVCLGELHPFEIEAGKAPGEITLTFDRPIFNGSEADFAVFANGFVDWNTPQFYGMFFAELAYVEVSTDGQVFARFDSISLTEEPTVPFVYGCIDSSDVLNLAGKHANADGQSWGTPFDLGSLSGAPEVLVGQVDLNNIRYVRIVDIPGSGDFVDSDGNPIYDAWATYGTGGIDLEALGVLNPLLLGDMDASGSVNNNDITPFVMALTDPDAYLAAYGLDVDVVGDIDGSGAMNNNDITPFVSLLTGAHPIPEPVWMAWGLLGAAAARRKRR